LKVCGETADTLIMSKRDDLKAKTVAQGSMSLSQIANFALIPSLSPQGEGSKIQSPSPLGEGLKPLAYKKRVRAQR